MPRDDADDARGAIATARDAERAKRCVETRAIRADSLNLNADATRRDAGTSRDWATSTTRTSTRSRATTTRAARGTRRWCTEGTGRARRRRAR